jgi:hypothetical protein
MNKVQTSQQESYQYDELQQSRIFQIRIKISLLFVSKYKLGCHNKDLEKCSCKLYEHYVSIKVLFHSIILLTF